MAPKREDCNGWAVNLIDNSMGSIYPPRPGSLKFMAQLFRSAYSIKGALDYRLKKSGNAL